MCDKKCVTQSEFSKFANILPFNKEQLSSFKCIPLLNFKTRGCIFGKEEL